MVRRLRLAPVPVRGEGDHPGSRRPVPSRFACWRPVRSSCGLRGRVRGLENCVPRAEQLGAGEWITGYGWSEDELAEQRRPFRWDLDDAAPANPVVLTRAGGHSSVASSLALEAAGLAPDTQTPPGGIIELDDRGRMNGILREGAQGLVSRLVPDPTPEELRVTFVENLRRLLALGITSIIHAGVDIAGYAGWEAVYAEHAGELPRAACSFGCRRIRNGPSTCWTVSAAGPATATSGCGWDR